MRRGGFGEAGAGKAVGSIYALRHYAYMHCATCWVRGQVRGGNGEAGQGRAGSGRQGRGGEAGQGRIGSVDALHHLLGEGQAGGDKGVRGQGKGGGNRRGEAAA